MLEKNIKYLPLSLFTAYFIKAIVFSVSYPEMGILAILAGAACYFHSLNNDKKLLTLEDKINLSHKALDEKLTLATKSFDSRVNEVESIKAQLNAIKVNSLTRPLSNAR